MKSRKQKDGWEAIGFTPNLIRKEVEEENRRTRKEADEQGIRDLQKQKLEKEIELLQNQSRVTAYPKLSGLPYNKLQAQVNFDDLVMPIPRNTNMELLCRVVFSSKLGSIWEWDKIITHKEWGEREKDLQKAWWRKTYHAALGVNEKVGKITGIYDLLLCPSTKQVQINPKYLK